MDAREYRNITAQSFTAVTRQLLKLKLDLFTFNNGTARRYDAMAILFAM